MADNLSAEQRMMEQMEYARREDIRVEKDFWRDVLHAACYEEKMTVERLQNACKVADIALNEFKLRFK